MQAAESRGLEPASIRAARLRPTIASKQLLRVQRRVALATILIPSVGAVIAIATIPVLGYVPLAVALLLVMHLLTMLGITVGYHRHFAHRAFKCRDSVRVLLGALGGMAAQGPLIHWVSNHRRHHEFSDLPGDPHSPNLGEDLGPFRRLWHAHVGWMLTGEVTNPARYAKDLLRDPLVRKINRLYLLWVGLGLALPAVVGGLWVGSWGGVVQGFLWGGVVRIVLVHHSTWAINSITHLFGSRPHATSENSRNNPWLVIPSAGEAWHNNHHAFPSSARFGLEWWQLDLGWLTIRLLESLRLAWDVKEAAPRAATNAGSSG
jgi:stearoyl-CoA desaturase (delta-9 desaturase)